MSKTDSLSSPQSSRATSSNPHSQAATPDSSASDSPAQWPITRDQPSDSTPSQLQAFLQDLHNYVPLGSIPLRLPDDVSGQFTHDWTEIDKAATVLSRDNEIAHDIDKLKRARLVRLFVRLNTCEEYSSWASLRIYYLPDDAGRSYLDRNDQTARKALKQIMTCLDRKPATWEACFEPDSQTSSKTLCFTPEGDHSLFYIFNTLRSPSPEPHKIQDKHTREAMRRLLDSTETFEGLRTDLYAYQRRSAAIMTQREACPARILDPRLEKLLGPTGASYYYDKETGNLVRNRREYEEPRGGILAETMGYGKTLICLAVILATRGHFPQIPPEHSEGLHPIRERTASLLEMTASTIGRERIPWKRTFEGMRKLGVYHESCVNIIRENVGAYVIPGAAPRRSRRLVYEPKGETIRLCSSTLIIVPANLVVQWRDEIRKHIDSAESLQVLILDDVHQAMPSSDELLDYDIVLLSKPRFEREVKADKDGPEYRSPMKDLHWLRIIVDEGHSFASTGTKSNAVHVLDQLHVERRWIVSGTPANGLMGIEVSLAAHATLSNDQGSPNGAASRLALEARKLEEAYEQECKDLEKLGHIVVDFLKLKPWANSRSEDAASWQRYIMTRGTGQSVLGKRRVPQGSKRRKSGQQPKASLSFGQQRSHSLRSTLESLVIRHRIEDIEKDLQLPPLHNRIIDLEPSYYDKLSINLFILVLTSNAVTSERTDQDYMFHPRNRKLLNALITNLRHAGFWWTAFTEHDVSEALRHCKEYLEQGKISEEDRGLLAEVFAVGKRALASSAWRTFSQYHELGIYLDAFPEDACQAWALHSERSDPLLLGTAQVKLAQQYIASNLYATNPAEGLPHAGIAAMDALRSQPKPKSGNDHSKESGVPKSSVTEEPKVKGTHTTSRGQLGLTPTKTKRRPSIRVEDCSRSCSPKQLKSVLKVSNASDSDLGLPPTSPLSKTTICGTASAKLSYLIDRVTTLQKEEKILIFYEGDNIAYYIGEALELVDVKHLIYAKSLSNARRAAYIATFNNTETFRVLLMDVHQAAHGLHIASASRVFFVNPVWQPNVEAQAIKRAHRIGQTRPVFAETLVLRDTLEDSMLQRRRAMTTSEHQRAEKSLLDDSTMGSIIRNAKFIPMSNGEECGMASLAVPQRVFGRVEGSISVPDDPDADIIMPDGISLLKPRRPSKRELAFLDADVPRLTSDATGASPTKRRRVHIATPSDRAEDSASPGGIMMETPKKNRRRQASKMSPIAQSTQPGDNQQTTNAYIVEPRTPQQKRIRFALEAEEEEEEGETESQNIFGSSQSVSTPYMPSLFGGLPSSARRSGEPSTALFGPFVSGEP